VSGNEPIHRTPGQRPAETHTSPIGRLLVGIGAHSLHNALSVLFAEGFVFLVLLVVDWIGCAFLAVVIISAARSEGL
jgi:hypothetical protein